MSGPTLALGISAPGYQQVVQLAEAIERLDRAMLGLKGSSGGATAGLGGLAALTSEVAKIRQGLGEASAGLRTEIADLKQGITKSLTDALSTIAKGAKSAGAKAAKETEEAIKQTEGAAKSGLDRFKAQMMVGAQNYEQARLAQIAKQDGADKKYLYSMMVGSAKVAEAQQQASDREEGAKLAYRIKLMTGSAKIAEQQAAATEREDGAKLAYRIKLMTGSAKIAEAQAEAAEREDAAKLAYRIKMMVGSAKIVEDQEAQAARELAAAEKKAAIVDLASRTAEAAYQRASQRAQVRMSIGAASQLAAGIDPSIVTQRYGASATSAAQSSSLDALRAQYKALGEEADKVHPKIKLTGDQLNYAHSAARGLASGFGALWLTWGQIIPLLAGAAVSHGFVQVIKMGAEVQQTFATIRVLAGATAEDVGVLNRQMNDLAASSQYGPRELANAMKTLSLAGLNTKEVYTAVKDVLNFSTAGDTSIEKAADVMTTVGTAFQVSAQNYSYVGDTIAKAAAESKSSVESMGEAFKTASVINQQYGVSLEDTAVGLALLANAGIQGTAAGTALRNMYADLSGRTPKVTKALQELGVQAIDPLTGKMREQAKVFEELMKALAQRTPTAQFKYIQDIFSERGGKEAIAIMTALQAKAKELGSTASSAYEELAQKISDAAGFTAAASAQMTLTPLNQMKSVASSLEKVLVETFESLQPMVLDFATQLKEIINSDEFKTTLQQLMTLVGQLTMLVVDHGRQILTVVAAYVGLKAITGILTTVATGWAGLQVALAGAAGAMGAAGVASALLVPGLNILVGVATAAASAWALYQLWGNKAKQTTEELGTNNVKELLKRLEDEEERLRKINEARAKGITLMELEQRAQYEKMKNEPSKELAAAKNALNEFDQQSASRKYLSGLPKDSRIPGSGGAYDAKAELSERARLQAAVNKAEIEHGENLLKVERAMEGIANQGKQIAEAERKAAEDRKLNAPKGSLTAPLRMKAGRDSGMSTVQSELDTELGSLRSAYQNQQKLTEDSYKAEELSAGQYFAKVSSLAQEVQANEAAALRRSTALYDKEYGERVEHLKAALKGPELAQALENLGLQYDKFTTHVNAVWDKLVDDTKTKQAELVLSFERDTNKLSKANDQYWLKAEQTMQKDLAASQAKRDLANASDEVRVQAEAAAKVDASHTAILENLNTELSKAKKARDDFYATFDNRDIGESEGDAAAALTRRVQVLTDALTKAQTEVSKLKGMAQQDAVNDLNNQRADKQRKEIENMSKDVTGKLADAILDGGKTGFKGLEDWVTEYLFKKPLRIVLQAVFQPIGNAVANFAMNTLGLGSTSGPGAGIGSGGFSLGSLFSGGGGNIVSTAANAMGFGTLSASNTALVTGITGDAASAAAASAAAGSAGSAGTLAGSLSAAGPYIAAAVAAYTIGKKLFGGGETRYGAEYVGTDKLRGPSGGEIDGTNTRGAIKTTQDYINSAIAQLGGSTSISNFVSGLESSGKGKGFAYAGGTLSNGTAFGQSTSEVGRANRRGSMSQEAAAAAFAEELQQSTLQALQASDIKGKLADYIRSLGDIDALTGEELKKTYDRVTKALSEQLSLQDRLFQASATPLEKLKKTRDAERKAIDETNKELLEQVYAQEDLNTAASALVAAYNEQASTLGAQVNELKDYAKGLRSWVQDALVGDSSPLSLFEQLNASAQQYSSTLALAKSGDKDARGALTGKAGTYLENLKNTASSRLEYATGFAKVTSDLSLEAASADSQATLLQQQLDTAKAQLTALGLIDGSVKTFAQAWADYNNAKDNLAKAKAAADAATYTPPASSSTSSSSGAAAAKPIDNSGYAGIMSGVIDRESGFADGGYHWGGLRLVGERGPELEVTGSSYIHDAAATRRILSGGDSSQDDTALLEELRGLRAEMQANVQFTFQLQKDFRELKLRGFPVTNNEDGNGVLTTTV